MRRSQSLRHHSRPSVPTTSSGATDLGVLIESDAESTEDALRRQLLDKERENDKLKLQIQSLQVQLAQRPPAEAIQNLEKEYKHLEILLQGTNRENEKAMNELERSKAKEKMLERELRRVLGENWADKLDYSDMSTISPQPFVAPTTSSLIPPRTPALLTTTDAVPSSADAATVAHIEQVRLLILGMEQRLQAREEKLGSQIDHAEQEGKRFAEAARAIGAISRV